MPRLSVDVDLTYVSIEDRDTSLKNIVEALKRIKSSIEVAIPQNAYFPSGENPKIAYFNP